MNKKDTQTTKKVVIKREEYINKKTGELEVFDVIKQESTDFNFNKVWLGLLMQSIDAVGNKKMQVLRWLMENKNSNNEILGTQQEISNLIGVSKPIVSQTIKALKEIDAIRQPRSGTLMLNPDLIFKGRKEKRMKILLDYRSIDPTNTKTGDE
ncbi:replication/maintenance protein RepL [Vibrio alginolyticus]|nr:replication/maintenance protein RepL [Vibrio alginolyticus]